LFTVSEFYQMADAGIFREDDRVELLAGEIVEMRPIGSRHASCVDRLARSLHQQADTSAEVDRGVKVPLYARAAIPEVWVVDLSDRYVDVCQDPHGDGYRQHRPIGPRDRLTSVSVPVLSLPAGDVLA
jgi:Uma2 family endonuclease